MVKVLIFSPHPEDREYLFNLVREGGLVYTASEADKAASLLASVSFAVVILDLDTADHPLLKAHFPKIPGLLFAGRDEEKLKETIRTWPGDRFVDYLLVSGNPLDAARARRCVSTALELAGLKDHVADMASSKASAERKLHRIYAEIKDLGGALTNGFLREIEKRDAIQARYSWFLALKQKIEDILRKLYAADDVSHLLSSVLDIKDIVRVSGLSIYILEESEALGRYLKPLVWDDAYLTHADFSSHITLFDARDFAAEAARTGKAVCLENPAVDPRCARRYLDLLRTPLRSLLCLPLKHEANVVGVLEVYNRGDDGTGETGFTEEDRRILRGLTEHIAMAMTKLNLIQYDALTGLLRPDPFFQKVMGKLEIAAKRRQGTGSSAMVMGDVDWFKQYNDRNGQEAGNRLLQELGGVLKSAIRDGDLLCRYGGEEFLFFLTGVAGLEEATLLTERIRKTVEEHVFEFEQFQPRHNLTMSFGVTMIPRESVGTAGTAAKTFLKTIAGEADLALAEAKGKRMSALKMSEKLIVKNRVCAFVREKATIISKTSLLKSPAEKAYVEKRADPRFFTSTLCLYRESGGHRVAGTIDLSLGGVRLSSETSLAPAQPLELLLVLGNQARSLRGEVVHGRPAGPTAVCYDTGIRFLDLSAEDLAALEAYFRSLIKREIPLA